MASETVTIEGHIIDSLTLPKVLDEVIELGATYEIVELRIGTRHEDTSHARIKVTTETEDDLTKIIERLRQHGANPDTIEDAELVAADVGGAFPPGFYSTTNLETEIRVAGKWVPVMHPEMDCGVVVEGGGARTIAMSDVAGGMQIVMAGLGIRVHPLDKPRADEASAASGSSGWPGRLWSTPARGPTSAH